MRMMTIRRGFLRLVKRYELPIKLVIKFLVGLYVFTAIHGIGLYDARAARLFEGGMAPLVTLFLALLFAMAPTTAGYLLMTADIFLQTSRAPEAAILVAVVCLLAIIFYVRLAPKAAWLLLATVIAYHFKLPYVVVLFAGLYVGVPAVAPVALGTWAARVIPGFLALARDSVPAESGFDIMALPTTAAGALDGALNALIGSPDWIVSAFIFTVVILGMYAVRYAPIDYAKEISIGFGTLACILCFIIAAAIMDGFVSPLGAALGTLAAAAILVVIRLFDSLPDYPRQERVQFEDEENLYLVKIVPKK